MTNNNNGSIPSWIEINNILGKAFQQDMKDNNRRYTVTITPKRKGKLEISFDR